MEATLPPQIEREALEDHAVRMRRDDPPDDKRWCPNCRHPELVTYHYHVHHNYSRFCLNCGYKR